MNAIIYEGLCATSLSVFTMVGDTQDQQWNGQVCRFYYFHLNAVNIFQMTFFVKIILVLK